MPGSRILRFRRAGKRLFLAFLGVWLISSAAYFLTTPSRPHRPLKIAHRGQPSVLPENTLAGFALAHGRGADLWETDVRASAEGQLFLMHDSSLRRTTGLSGSIESLPAVRLRQLGIPTFEDTLALAWEHQANLLAEVKGSTAGIEEAIVSALSNHSMEGKITLSSFSTASLRRLHQLRPQLPLCRLYYPWDFWVGQNPDGVVAVAPMAEALLIHPWMVRQAQARGYQVWPWFACLESKLTVAWILKLGVDGLMVDDFTHWPGGGLPPDSHKNASVERTPSTPGPWAD